MGPEPFLEHFPFLSLPGLLLWSLSLFSQTGRKWALGVLVVVLAVSFYSAFHSEPWRGNSFAFNVAVYFTLTLYPVLFFSWIVRSVWFLIDSMEKNESA